jgi:outer membrane autotransporter protein
MPIQQSLGFKVALSLVALSLCLMTPLHAQISLQPLLSGIPDLSPPQFAVARAIEDLCPNLTATTGPTGDLRVRCSELVVNARRQDQAAVLDPLLQMATKEVSSQGTNSVETSAIQFINIGARLTALRRGATGISVQGIALHDLERTLPSAAVASLWRSQDGTTIGDVGSSNYLPRFDTRFSAETSQPMLAQAQSAGARSSVGPSLFERLGIFMNGTFNFGDKDTTSREAGFDFDTYGVTGGVDYRFTDNLVLGLAFGYNTTDSDFAAARGKMDADTYTFSAFGTYYLGALYIDGIFSYGWNSFDSTRNISYSIPTIPDPLSITTVSQTARSETDGTQYAFSLSTGYDFSVRGFTVGPYGRLNYLKADIDAFQERIDNTNAGFGLALAIGAQDVESLTGVLGGQASYALSTGFGVLVPQMRFEWEHEFLNDRRTVGTRFINDPANTPVLLQTDNPDRDYFNLGAGLSAVFQRNVSAFVYYETVLALRDVTAHKIAAGLRLAF